MLRSWPTHVHTLYNVGDLTLNGHLLGHCPTGYYSIYRDYSTLHAANPSMMNLPNVSFRLFHCYYYYCAHYVVLLLSGFDAVSRRPSPPASACVTRAGWLCNGDSLSSLQDNPPTTVVVLSMLACYLCTASIKCMQKQMIILLLLPVLDLAHGQSHAFTRTAPRNMEYWFPPLPCHSVAPYWAGKPSDSLFYFKKNVVIYMPHFACLPACLCLGDGKNPDQGTRRRIFLSFWLSDHSDHSDQ